VHIIKAENQDHLEKLATGIACSKGNDGILECYSRPGTEDTSIRSTRYYWVRDNSDVLCFPAHDLETLEDLRARSVFVHNAISGCHVPLLHTPK
jgi:hypothetical protein